jgi:hypothetical protein
MNTDSQVYSIIIKWMISESTNPTYIQKLNEILQGIENKNFIEEFKHPRHLSLVMFGTNLFPYRIEQYREMAELIKG